MVEEVVVDSVEDPVETSEVDVVELSVETVASSIVKVDLTSVVETRRKDTGRATGEPPRMSLLEKPNLPVRLLRSRKWNHQYHVSQQLRNSLFKPREPNLPSKRLLRSSRLP